MKIGICLSVIPILGVFLNLRHIPLHWIVFLLLSIAIPIYSLLKKKNKLTKITRLKESDAVKTRRFGLTVMSGFKINRRVFTSMFKTINGIALEGKHMLHLINGVQMDMSLINEVVIKGDVEIW